MFFEKGVLEQVRELSVNGSFLRIPGLIFFKDKNGAYLNANQDFLKLAKLSSLPELIGKTDEDLPWKKHSEVIRKNDLTVFKTEQFLQVEEIISIDNKVQILLTTRRPLKGADGTVLGLMGSSVDITAIKTFEHQLQQDKHRVESERDTAKSYLNNVVRCTPGNLYWKDLEGRYLGANEFFLKVAGLESLEELLGKTDRDLPWGGQYEELRNNDLYVVQSGQTLNIEETVTLADNAKKIFMAAKMPLRDIDGSIIGIVGNSLDITQQKETEEALKAAKNQAEAANKSKTEFLENMRHDIRTPLSGIIGLSELLSNEMDREKIREFTACLDKSCKELLRFLNEILESINVASGEIPLLKKRFDLEETLKNVVDLHQSVAMEKALALTLEVDETIPKHLIGDPVRIYRIVLELLVNALKFTEHGHVRVFAKLAKRENRDVIVKIFVEDSGVGIPSEKHQDLFVRFKRFTPSYEGIYKGSGLGLSIVKQFLEDLDGEIYMDSQLDQGTRFVCIIPLKESLVEDEPFSDSGFLLPKRTGKMRHAPEAKKPEPRIGRYGLVVEDQSIAALVVKTLLAEEGCEIDVAENGERALARVKEHQYDFILMDIGLPDMDGYEVTKAIRLLEQGGTHQSFIIGLTGHVDASRKRLGLAAGMNVVLVKPLTREMSASLLRDFVPIAQPYEKAVGADVVPTFYDQA